MSQVFLHLSNIQNSSISLGGDCVFETSNINTSLQDLLIQSLEINRQLVAGICSQWSSEEELYSHLLKLMKKHKNLEYEVSLLLKS